MRYPPAAWQLYGAAFQKLSRYFQRIGQEGVVTEAPARAIAHALTARRPKNTYFVGPDARQIALLQVVLHGRLRDRFIMRMIGLSGRAEPGAVSGLP